MRYAGFWLRFIACVIDNMILSTFQTVFFLVGLIPLAFMSPGKDWDNLDEATQIYFGVYVACLILITMLTFWPYFACFEASKFQGTPGKLALGLIVVDEEGKRIGFWRATGRNFAKIISSLILNIGFMMAGWTEKKQALHDVMCGCLVVRKPKEVIDSFPETEIASKG